MKDMFRYITTLFGYRYVVLVDHDGGRTIRVVRFMNGKPYACRRSFGIRDVFLLDGGGLENGAYVKRWEPYEPCAAKQWPTP